MSSKLISLLMPAYNCEKFVKQAIDSILSQTYTNFELLIADDSSTDFTKKIIDSYTDQRIKTFHNEINIGYLKASNKLFKLCKGEYISFQDADDYADSDRLFKLVDYLDKNPEIACVGSNIIKVDAEGKEIYKTMYPLSDKDIREGFQNYNIVMTGSALMFKREVLNKVGFYNEYFNRIGSEDTYMFSKILDNYKVANLEDAIYYYRMNPSSVGATHKDPRSSVGHELILWMQKRRINNKTDYISANKKSVVDKYAALFISINKTKTNKWSGMCSYLFNTIKAPLISIELLRLFLTSLRA